MKVGVYVCDCGINIAATVNVPEVVKKVAGVPHVTICREYKYMCSEPGQDIIKKDIEEMGLDRVVVASCSPRMHEPTFRTCCKEADMNPFCFEMANIREQCSWVTKEIPIATEKAFDLIKGAVARSVNLEPLEMARVGVTPTAMVIGAGIAGIQAALDLGDMGYKTYLVEREPSVGGRMAQLDKTFPTLDCSACILTPKMVDVAKHPNIELMAYSEVVSVDGYVGNFKVKIRKKPAYVDWDKCVGCGICADACRLSGRIPNDFNLAADKRAVPYIPFPQAVPLKYTIDGSRCLMVTRGKCGDHPLCEEACDANAIDFTQKEEVIELAIGGIIVATGFDLFDATNLPEYGYGKFNNVISGLEFERLVSSSGPTGGDIEIEGEKPKKVVFIQCVGSRDREGSGNEHCSRVCCMYTAKQAHMVREKVPDSDVTVYYTDVRAFGKGFEEFYVRVKDEGVDYRRRKLTDNIEIAEENGKTVVRAEGHEDVVADLVVLATGIVPREDSEELVNLLRISRSADGFFMEAHPKLKPIDTFTTGVFLGGCAQGPKDIPDTVAQASGTASRVGSILSKEFLEVGGSVAVVNPDLCAVCLTCVRACPYHVPSINEENVAFIEVAECQGCGVCASECPAKAIQLQHYKDDQMIGQCKGILEEIYP